MAIRNPPLRKILSMRVAAYWTDSRIRGARSSHFAQSCGCTYKNNVESWMALPQNALEGGRKKALLPTRIDYDRNESVFGSGTT